CMKVVPERASVLYLDKEEFGYSKIYVHLIFYEYLHNEYRRSFVEMHFKFCDLLQKEAYVGGMLKKIGVTCPFFSAFFALILVFSFLDLPFDG
ncbi:Uncharacterized protein OBRU01_19353, partial [Operophtera brumata]